MIWMGKSYGRSGQTKIKGRHHFWNWIHSGCIAVWRPARIVCRPKQFCNSVEQDADAIMVTIADYFSVVHRASIARENIEKRVSIGNPWTFVQCGDQFYIHIVDESGKCPAEIRQKHPNWNANIYTRKY